MLTKLLPVKQKNNQINVLVILENTYADSLFFDSLVHLVEKYNSNINYYIIDNFNTDSDDHKYYEGNYSYGPYYIYRSYMREYFFNSNIYYDKFKIDIKPIKLSRELKFNDIKKNYNVIVIRKLNDYYSKLLSLNYNQTIILLDTSIDDLKKYKIQSSSNEIFIINSFLFDQINSKAKIKYFLKDYFMFIRKSYEIYLKNELISCFEHDDDEFNRLSELLNFDFKK